MADLKALTAKVSKERRLEECPICLEQLPQLWKRQIVNITCNVCETCVKGEGCKKCSRDFAQPTKHEGPSKCSYDFATEHEGPSRPLFDSPMPTKKTTDNSGPVPKATKEEGPRAQLRCIATDASGIYYRNAPLEVALALCQSCGKNCCKKCFGNFARQSKCEGVSCPLCRSPTPKTMEEGFSQLLSKANEGKSFAQYGIGHCYLSGRGVQADPTKAVPWLEEASRQGWYEASLTLGVMYGTGEGVEKDIVKAKHYWEIAAASEDAFALHMLAVRVLSSPSDTEERIKVMRRAAEDGLPWAQYQLGSHYYNGCGVPKSNREALLWCLKAAEQGDREAQFASSKVLLGTESGLFLSTRPHMPNMPKAMYWLRKAVAQGHPNSKRCLKDVEASLLSSVCFGCFRTSVRFNRCTRCYSAYYCSKKCQVEDWTKHKEHCIPKDIEKRSPEKRISFFTS